MLNIPGGDGTWPDNEASEAEDDDVTASFHLLIVLDGLVITNMLPPFDIFENVRYLPV
jgi:uncharacterized protein with GYD domain